MLGKLTDEEFKEYLQIEALVNAWDEIQLHHQANALNGWWYNSATDVGLIATMDDHYLHNIINMIEEGKLSNRKACLSILRREMDTRVLNKIKDKPLF